MSPRCPLPEPAAGPLRKGMHYRRRAGTPNGGMISKGNTYTEDVAVTADPGPVMFFRPSVIQVVFCIYSVLYYWVNGVCLFDCSFSVRGVFFFLLSSYWTSCLCFHFMPCIRAGNPGMQGVHHSKKS